MKSIEEEIAEMTAEERKAAIALGKKLADQCQHEMVYHDAWDKEDPDGGSAYCVICGEDLGWWCPVSPDHQCEYYGNHRRGHPGINGWSYEGEWYDGDDCIYCHQPEERK